MFETFDMWMFLAGLGIFLFGIYLMEESIRLLSGRAFKSMIRRYTATPVRGILSGSVSTAVLQSSSAVSLMVLAFVGAGIMNLINAVAVMMGAKIGTTMTAWIVAVFGFKFSIEAFALPMIGIGGLGLIIPDDNPVAQNASTEYAGFDERKYHGGTPG
jgi:phosphate:Na+ symporter